MNDPQNATIRDGRSKLRLAPALLAATLLAGGLPCSAQIFKLVGGTSTLINAHGMSIGITGENYESWVGFGYLNGFRTGFFFKTDFAGSTFRFGDDPIQFDLPSDSFGGNPFVPARGVSVTREFGGTKIFGFGGVTSREIPTTFFRSSTTDSGLAVFFLDKKIQPDMTFFSRNAVAGKLTTIHGINWNPNTSLEVSIGGGVGAGDPYYASSVKFEKKWITARGTFVAAGTNFRRLQKRPFATAEPDRENFSIALRPIKTLTFTVGRSNLIAPPNGPLANRKVRFDRLGASWNIAGFGLAANLFESDSTMGRARSRSFMVSKRINGHLSASATYLTTNPAAGPKTEALVAVVTERITPRIQLEQFLTRRKDRTSVSVGGRFESNPLTLGVGYKTLYLPFSTGSQFRQAMVVSAGFRPYGNYQIKAQTFFTAAGETKYTITASTFLYRGIINGVRTADYVFTMPKFIVVGYVVDETGAPIEGAALTIGDDFVFTDSQGRFFLRTGGRRPLPLQVLTDHFLLPGNYAILTAPVSVAPYNEEMETGDDVLVVLQHVRPDPVPSDTRKNIGIGTGIAPLIPLPQTPMAVAVPPAPELPLPPAPTVPEPAAAPQELTPIASNVPNVPPASPVLQTATPAPPAPRVPGTGTVVPETVAAPLTDNTIRERPPIETLPHLIAARSDIPEIPAPQQALPAPAPPATPRTPAEAEPVMTAGLGALGIRSAPEFSLPELSLDAPRQPPFRENLQGEPQPPAAPASAEPINVEDLMIGLRPMGRSTELPGTIRTVAPAPTVVTPAAVSPAVVTPDVPETPPPVAAPKSTQTLAAPQSDDLVPMEPTPTFELSPAEAAALPVQKSACTSPEEMVAESQYDAFFAFDDAQLNIDGEIAMHTVARCLRSFPEAGLIVEGHADEVGSATYNAYLGELRASIVVRTLLSLGIRFDRLEIVTKGESAPFCTESREEACRSLNRRAHLILKR